MAEAAATCTIGPLVVVADARRDLFRFVRGAQQVDASTDMSNLIPFRTRLNG